MAIISTIFFEVKEFKALVEVYLFQPTDKAHSLIVNAFIVCLPLFILEVSGNLVKNGAFYNYNNAIYL